MGSKRTTKKDTVPSYKSQTRDTKNQTQNAKPAAKQATPPTKPVAIQVKAKAQPQKAKAMAVRTQSSGIPHNRMLSGLKAPKAGRSEGAIHSRLKKKSPWFQSISDPLHGADCKIPDETGVETGTCQLVERISMTTNAQGFCGMRVFSPYANDYNPSGNTQVGVNWQDCTADGPTDVSWGTINGATRLTGPGWAFEGIDDLKAITAQHRIVSAEIIVESEVSLAENKGEMVLFNVPFANLDAPLYTSYLNHYKSAVVPINMNKPAIVRWYPESRMDWSFKSFIQTDGTTPSDSCSLNTDFPYWQLGVLVNGADLDVSFRVQIVVNYEFIPRYNTLNVVDASPSPQDVTEVDLVESWTQDLPVAGIISPKQATSSPSSVSPAHGENDEGTGFGMFFNVIKELAPLAMAMLI